MESNHTMSYDVDKSSDRMDDILNASDNDYCDKDSIPARSDLTFKNGYYVNVTAIFIDIVGSSDMTDEHKRPTLAKMYRAFLSECVAIMNAEIDCKEININGDCVWGVFDTPYKSDIDNVISVAARLNSMIKILNYKLRKKNYSEISVNESAVLTLVSDTLRAIAEYSRNDRTEFIHTVQETQVAQQSADISKKRRRLAAAQKRAGELEKLICKIYEDNALGKLPDARYRALDAQYAKEQDALEIEIAELEKAVTGYEQSQKSAEKFIALIDKYENFDTLTNTMLNEFVEKILVHERARKGSQDTTQEIEIYFNFLGRYIPPSLQPVPLTPEEQEELRKKEERKDRLHQNYLKRKASGAQKRYEDKIKAKKKAEMDAKKALIRAEDMKKGVFSTVGQLPKEEPRKGSIAASAAV